MKTVYNICAGLLCAAFVSCSERQTSEYPITVNRFDKVLLKAIECDTLKTGIITGCYRNILDIYATGIIKCSTSGSSVEEMVSDLKAVYLSTEGFKQLYEYTENEYSDIRDIEQEISSGFENCAILFPDKNIPRIYTHVSGFSQSIITSDSLMSIALDNYLGKEYPGYEGRFFEYQLKGKERNRIVPDLFTVYLYNNYQYTAKTRRLIDGIIYEGCIVYAISRILPNRKVSDILNYSPEQMKWCRNNEGRIWSYMVKAGHLYSSDQLVFSKYLNEAPYTSFFGKESPDRIGRWIGYRIIERYIRDSDKASTLTDILSGKYDTSEILVSSEYGNK